MRIAEPVKQYVPLSVLSLTINSSHSFDLFQRDGGEFRLFKSARLRVSETELERLKSSGRSTLYVKPEDRAQLFEYMRENLARSIQDPDIPAQVKAEMLTETSAAAISRVLDDPESEVAIREVCDQGHQRVALALMGEDERDVMRTTPRSVPYSLSHALAVSNLSILLALACGTEDSEELSEIGSGALLHELGKVVIDRTFYTKKPGERLISHRRLHRYPEIGAKIVERSMVSPRAHVPIREHQERLDGSGFPSQLSGDQISFAGRVVAICDYFDEQTNPTSLEPRVRPFDVLRSMTENCAKFDRHILHSFIRLLGGVNNLG